MANTWQEMALVAVHNGSKIHKIVKLELIDAGLIRFNIDTENLVLTEQGKRILDRVLSPDHASKRY